MQRAERKVGHETPISTKRFLRFCLRRLSVGRTLRNETVAQRRRGFTDLLHRPLRCSGLYAQQAPPANTRYTQLDCAQLDQLLASIALYPDSVVAQILAAATYPSQVVEADRFLERNGSLPQSELVRMVDEQPWDPSIKALTVFPSVLSNFDRNLDCTTELENAYYNQPQNVMSAIQTMRDRAYAAGTLKTTPQQTVLYQPSSIVIQPVNLAVVGVPMYNP